MSPFGLKHKGYNNAITGRDHQYGFNGKEENDELGLEWLDFGARNYDASLGRWMNIDPLAEQYYDKSPFIYTLNNPVFFIDPDGERVDVTELANSDKEDDKWLLLNLMISLADISGETITQSTDKNGRVSLSGSGACDNNCSEAGGYISYLLDPDGDTINVKSTDGGSIGFVDGNVYLDAGQINGIQHSLKKAGYDKRVMSVGMAFLHETLHTKYGADFFTSENDERNKNKWDGTFHDNRSSESPAGPTTDIINRFREDMGLPVRSARGSKGYLHITKDGNKEILKYSNIPIPKKKKKK